MSYLPDIHRTLPHSADAEQGVLSSMLIYDPAIDTAVEQLGDTGEKFHVPAHITIYETILKMHADGIIVDLISLTKALRDGGQLDAVGGPAFVTGLFTFVPTASNVAYYAKVVREKWILRTIITHGTSCAALAYDDQEDVTALVTDFEAGILALAEQQNPDEYVPTKEICLQVCEDVDAMYERKGQINGLSTGLPDLDAILDGLHDSEMIVIAARPSMGKTALAMNIAEHVAVDLGLPVAVFSLEMSKRALMLRMVCGRARVSLRKIRDGFMGEHDSPKITAAGIQIARGCLHLNDKSGATPAYVRSVARRWKKKFGIRLVVIDYLQQMQFPKHDKNRENEIGKISGSLKALAKELNIPVIVLAQLNRGPEKRETKRPALSDLRESGTIEQDADVVILLHRDEYYATTDEERAEMAGKAVAIIAKQRNGPTGDVPLTFIKEFTKFEPRAVYDENEA